MSKKISMQEALERVDRFQQQVDGLWSEAVSVAQAIAMARGISAQTIGFAGFSDGYYFQFVTDSFSYRDSHDQWQVLRSLNSATSDETELWDDLETALQEFGQILPPQDDRLVDDPITLGGFEGDLWLHLFADLDEDGYFQPDPDGGTMTIVEGFSV